MDVFKEYVKALNDDGFHYRITPLRWTNHLEEDVLLTNIDNYIILSGKKGTGLEKRNYVLYSVEKGTGKTGLHYHILLWRHQVAAFKTFIKSMGSVGNKGSSVTKIRDAYKVIKYVLKDGDIHMTQGPKQLDRYIRQMMATTFKPIDDFKDDNHKLEDRLLMREISIDYFYESYIDLCVLHNMRSRITPRALEVYFRYNRLRANFKLNRNLYQRERAILIASATEYALPFHGL